MRKLQEVLTVTTKGSDLRDEIVGWTQEDPSRYVPGRPIGYTPGARDKVYYETVLAALADGWQLLSPPVFEHEDLYDGVMHRFFEWWLVREKEG